MKENEVEVYLDDKPVGVVKVVDSHLLLYPLQRDKAHITTRSLNEVIEFFQKERED